MAAHRSTAWPLSIVAMGLVAYASFYPLRGWAWPDGSIFHWWLPRLAYESADDMAANVLGYLPLGAVWCLAHLRSGRPPVFAAALALLTCSVWSYGIELTQHFLPSRVPSFMDWALNTLGAAWGVLAALTAHALGAVDWWHRQRERWLDAHAGSGLALIALWPVGLLQPLPWPLGEGRLLPHLHALLREASEGSVWQSVVLPDTGPPGWAALLAWSADPDVVGLMEALTVTAGLLLPLAVASALAEARRFRIGLMTVLVGLAFAVSTLSCGLNFGLPHALAWVTLPSIIGLLLAASGGMWLVSRSQRTCALTGVVIALLLMLLVHLAPSDPYFAQALRTWESGLFIKFHGLTRWFSQLWPAVALFWLLGRVLRPATPRPQA